MNKFKYCQSQIEDNGKCKKQCNHCKEYYKPLENDAGFEYYNFEIKLTIIAAIILFAVVLTLQLL